MELRRRVLQKGHEAWASLVVLFETADTDASVGCPLEILIDIELVEVLKFRKLLG